MTHMVIFRKADGTAGQHQAENLEEATRFVENLRNTENVTDSRIFFMQEVPIEFKTVYKVEIIGAAPAAPVEQLAPVAEAAPVAGPVDEIPALVGADASEDGAQAGAGRFGLFSRS